MTTGHRPPLVSGRSHHCARHHHRGRDPPDLGRAGALSCAGQAGRLPLHLAERHGGPRPSTRQYLNSSEVLVTQAFDPALKAKVEVLPQQPEEFLNERYIRQLMKEKRGVAVFVPTRAEVEKLAAGLGDAVAPADHGVLPRRRADPGHPPLSRGGGRASLPPGDDRGGSDRRSTCADWIPWSSTMRATATWSTAAATCFTGCISAPMRSSRWPAGCTAGCRRRGFHPERPDSQLRVAPSHPARIPARRRRGAGRHHLRRARSGCAGPRSAGPARPSRRIGGRSSCSTARGLVENGRLTSYGREVEALPVERPWGELLVHAGRRADPDVAVCSNIESLHRMTREERDLHGVIVTAAITSRPTISMRRR